MKRKNKIIATLIALCVLVGAIGPTVDTVEAAYVDNRTYDATEEYFKLQENPYSYNGYRVIPFTTCNDWLSARPDGGTPIGEGMSVVTAENVKQGSKLVIEFQQPINSKEFNVITLTMKQVPGNSYDAYNSTDDILSTIRKSFAFSTYGLEKISFQTALFADDDGYVNAIILHNTKSEAGGQLFIDSFSVSASFYEENETYDDQSGNTDNITQGLVDSKNQYDGTDEYFVLQSSEEYNGIKILPISGYNDYLSQKADGGKGMGEGYALYTSNFAKKGNVVVLEFVNPIDSKEIDLLTLSLKHVPGNNWSVYKISDIKLENAIKTFGVGSYDIEKLALRTQFFADSDGMVRGILLKLNSCELEGQLFVDGYSLSNDPYQLDVTYDMTEEYVKVQTSGNYQGMTTAVFNERSKFWEEEAKRTTDTGYALVGHKADGKSLSKGDILILEFVTDISAEEFQIMNLTLATSSKKGATFEVYNVNDIKNGKLGEKKQTVDAMYWDFGTNSLPLSMYADEQGYVGAIALKLVSDEAATFSIGSFSLTTFNSLVEQGASEILDNKITVTETEKTYDFLIEFNKAGNLATFGEVEAWEECISLNGTKISEINAQDKFVQIEWKSIGRYYLQVSVDKSYDGEGKVFNTDKLFVGNSIELAEGMEFPNGDKLSQTYVLHVYSVDSITDVKEPEKEYAPIAVTRISSRIDANEDLQIDVYFNNAITGSTLYYVCNPDSFNRKSVAALGEKYYNADVAAAISYGGYKSSLLDNLRINGYSIGEWLAVDELSGSAAYNSAIMVHYGMAGNKVATIIVSKISDIGQTLKESYNNGDLSITFDKGLKFVSDKEMKETVSYRYIDEVWSKVAEGDFAVYYDGTKVEDGDYLKVDKAVRATNISIVGDSEYDIQEMISGNVVTFTISSKEEKLLTFQVEGEDVIPIQTNRGNSAVYLIGSVVILLGILVIITLYISGRRRKKNAKQSAN